MKLFSKRHTEKRFEEAPDLTELEELMMKKFGKKATELQAIAQACIAWADEYKWPNYDDKVTAMTELFHKMVRM